LLAADADQFAPLAEGGYGVGAQSGIGVCKFHGHKTLIEDHEIQNLIDTVAEKTLQTAITCYTSINVFLKWAVFNKHVFGKGNKQNLKVFNTRLDRRLRKGKWPGWLVIHPDKERQVRAMLKANEPSIDAKTGINWATINIVKARMEAGIPIPKVRPPSAPKTIKPWTVHDIRRTFATKLQEIKRDGKHAISESIIDRLIGHAVGTKLRGVYQLYDYWDERREASDLWDVYLRSIIDGTAPKIARSKGGRILAAA
jgi:integrase